MTGKRFQYNVNKNCIECDGKFVAYLNSIDGCRIANYWNGLYKENEQLKEQLSSLNTNVEKNCITCKYCETYDEGEGYGFVSLCDKDCMNTDGYFDWEYHRFKKHTECPLWECDKDKAEWWYK